MRNPPTRAAAYTRTGIVRRFLEQLSDADPGRVDAAYAEARLDLKGGDVRAFLQSLRVLGIVDAYGYTTDRARRMRAASTRGALMREALAEAYPELLAQWDRAGGMPRPEVEDFFKVQYGLSTSSSGPAAKLFCDLMREYVRATPARPSASPATSAAPPPPARMPEAAPAEEERVRAPSPMAAAPRGEGGPGAGMRQAALEAIRSSLHIEINENWSEERIQLVFDRMERLVGKILDQE